MLAAPTTSDTTRAEVNSAVEPLPANPFDQHNLPPTKSLHRMDLGLQRRFRTGGRGRITGIVEVFNVLNHANFGSYVTTEVSKNFSQPSFNGDIAYAPRQAQLGFRFEF